MHRGTGRNEGFNNAMKNVYSDNHAPQRLDAYMEQAAMRDAGLMSVSFTEQSRCAPDSVAKSVLGGSPGVRLGSPGAHLCSRQKPWKFC